MNNKLRILGIRGVPAAHGGFETFAHHFSLYLVKNGWQVEVFCQKSDGPKFSQDEWMGVVRSNIRVKSESSFWSVIFDFLCILHCIKDKTPCLILGYNTAVFSAILRLFRVPVVINMDGIEWKRAKWSPVARAWFWFNDWMGCLLGNKLVADNPGIADHLATRGVAKKTVMIPYGADCVLKADVSALAKYGLRPNEFCTVIARPEPENSILEIVQEFSKRKRGCKLVVLGDYSNATGYKKRVLDAAGDEVVFVGAIYDKAVVSALRFFSKVYFHGHTVGGTNPSLVEAMGAGNAVIAHGNIYNRWVLGGAGTYFESPAELASAIEVLLGDSEVLARMQALTRERFHAEFELEKVHAQYELVMMRLTDRLATIPARLNGINEGAATR